LKAGSVRKSAIRSCTQIAKTESGFAYLVHVEIEAERSASVSKVTAYDAVNLAANGAHATLVELGVIEYVFATDHSATRNTSLGKD
jgi:hypothetical protein